MSKYKRVARLFSFHDFTGITAFLEQMALEGWFPEKYSAYGWLFRSMEPAKLHFSVVYFAKAPMWNGDVNQPLLDFQALCAHTGWLPAVSSGQMQILYHPGEDPLPIETDPATTLTTIHRAMRGQLMGCGILAAFAALVFFVMGWTVFTQPVSTLSSPYHLTSFLCLVLTVLLNALELANYFRWHRKAALQAQMGAPLPPTRVWAALPYLTMLVLLVLLGSQVWKRHPLSALTAVICAVPALAIFFTGLYILCRERRWPSLACYLALIVLLALPSLTGLSSVSPRESSYQSGSGTTYTYYDNRLPLNTWDLTDTTQTEWSSYLKSDCTAFLTYTWAFQGPRSGGASHLEYEVVHVRCPALYPLCREDMLEDLSDSPWERCEAVDPAGWGANEAWQLYRHGEATGYFLLLYDTRMVGISLEQSGEDWSPTSQQMAAVGRTLGG